MNTISQSRTQSWVGHRRGSTEYRRLLGALFCAGIATFAQLYSPQGVLPQISTDLGVGAASAALMVSACTIGLAVGVIPWSMIADRVGRVKAMSVSVVTSSVLGLLTPCAPNLHLLLAGRLLQGLVLAGVPAIAIAYLTEEIAPEHAARAAGTFVSGTSIGGLLGRVVAGPITEVATWRIGMITVAVLCAAAAAGFVKLAPHSRGFTPASGRGANPEGTLTHRLVVNLRSPRQLTLFAQGFLLMGGFVAIYNFLAFRLTAAPYHLPGTVLSLIFFAYLAGTGASTLAGALATRFGRKSVLLTSIAIMITGVLITLCTNLFLILIGLVVTTVGFFGAHAIATGWAGRGATVGKAQASSLYNLFYYAGSSIVGWFGGIALTSAGWPGVALTVLILAGVAAGIAAFFLPRN
ncbi:MFS transporter [Mycolicibacterium brisbanense]|uniref:Arabinose efflux permease family protein n=1 Tax=Mycolicibacterium brisbanense TaxID=146020 RepID=A0A117I5D7_9MYCO|nr:MFS transporter [Mycolicibacterium brisbanense]MCV7161991.1 MFS transporter [Mycolicibacterium brisbanense]GAS88400.1 arabinose efflux permease family protein [Mycolicibacterium brisbanense]